MGNRLFSILLFFILIITCGRTSADIVISNDTTWSGTINVTEDVLLTDSSTLTISAGSTLLIDYGVSIKGGTQCHILIQGTAVDKVIIRSSNPGSYWGQIIVQGDSASIEIQFADIMSGQIVAMDSSILTIEDSYLHDYLKLPTKNIVYSHSSYFVHMNRCHVSDYWQVNFAYTPILIENSLFEYMHEDGIDCDNSPGADIFNCTFRNGLCEKGKIHSVDAIDFGKFDLQGLGSIGNIRNCLVYNITDKGVSAGEGCRQIDLTGNVFYNCGSGATIKDSSIADIINNTVVNCEFGIECIEKNPGLGGGQATGLNNILWNNDIPVFLDNTGSLFLTYSDVSFAGIFPGAGNINAYPMFADTLAIDFQLLPGSPAIGTGYNGDDMGAIFPVGGIGVESDYLNIGYPFSNEEINGDSMYSINWVCGDSIHFVDIEFSGDGGLSWNSIAQNTSSLPGNYLWTVPNIYSSKCFVRVTDVANSNNSSTQNTPFKIIPYGIKSAPPLFSYPAGYYPDSISLQLIAPGGTTVFYTLDGSEPNDNSFQYTLPITIEEQFIDTGFPEQNITATNPPREPLSYIRTAPVSQIGPNHPYWVKPNRKVEKIAVVKARAYTPGMGLGDVITNSYIIDQNGLINPARLPLISLCTDKENFFDYNSGVYIPGATFTGYSFTGNYEISGRISERPITFEYFDSSYTRIFNINAGVRVRGEWIRCLGEKALSLFARSEYDSINEFNYDFFKGYKRSEISGSMNHFKRLILRNNGNAWGGWKNTMLTDGMIQSLFDHLHFKYQAYQPAVVFLDGEYWGIHNIRELPDKYHLANTFSIDRDKITIVEDNLDGLNRLSTGLQSDVADYESIVDYVNTHDMNLAVNYNFLDTKIDIENFTDYVIAGAYSAKLNIEHNTGFWKYSGISYNPAAPYGRDGRWRWYAYDFDDGFYDSTANALKIYSTTDLVRNGNLLINVMLQSTIFKNNFISRTADLLNSSFKASRVIQRINDLKTVIEPEMDRHLHRWGNPQSMTRWQEGIDLLITFANARPHYFTDSMITFFNLDQQAALTVNVSDSVKGKIKVNTITINANLPGVDSFVYPWSGNYFMDFPVTLIAKAEPGFRFVEWLETGLTNDTLSISLTGDSLFTAVFDIDTTWVPVIYPQLYINEVVASNHSLSDNYGETADWLELYNPTSDTVDLAGWYLSDASDYRTKHKFASSDSTKILPNGFILLYADNETEQGVTHVAFKIDAGGDDIYLTAPDGYTLIDSVEFGLQVSDTSFGRYPDGDPNWIFFSNTTPGYSNVLIDAIQIPENNSFRIFPNPVSQGILHFNLPASFHLYNNLGEQLLYRKNATEVNLSSFSNGIYFIRTDEGYSARVIIVN